MKNRAAVLMGKKSWQKRLKKKGRKQTLEQLRQARQKAAIANRRRGLENKEKSAIDFSKRSEV